MLPERNRPVFEGPVRVLLGPQEDAFTAAGIETFLSSAYTVTSKTDRMGCQLDGPPIEHRDGFNIISDGIVNGSIQVPGSGIPIVLLADRQTTGGYPKIATVVSADLGADRAGAHRRNHSVRGRFGGRGGALRPRLERAIERTIAHIEPVGLAGLSSEALMKREPHRRGGVGAGASQRGRGPLEGRAFEKKSPATSAGLLDRKSAGFYG